VKDERIIVCRKKSFEIIGSKDITSRGRRPAGQTTPNQTPCYLIIHTR